MKRNRLICTVLAILLLTSLAACGEPAQELPEFTSATQTAPPDATGEPVSENALRMTQTGTVTKIKYEGEEVFEPFLSLAEPEFIIPALIQAMTPQGISYSEDTGLVYISSYAGGDDIPSVITAVDLESGELKAEYFLYDRDGSAFTSHVGGLAVTESELYVSAKLDSDGSYSIGRIPLSDLPAEGSHNVTVAETVPMAVSPSMMSCAGGMLWVGNFYHPDGGYDLPESVPTVPTADGEAGCFILGFDLSETGGKLEYGGGRFAEPDVVLIAPDRIQGVAYADGTVTLSQSYGRKNNSHLLSYALDLTAEPDTTVTFNGADYGAYILDSTSLKRDLTAMPMTEGLAVLPDGDLLVLFESGATKYGDGKFRTDYVWRMSGDK